LKPESDFMVKEETLKKRIRKAGLITSIIAKSAIWYPIKIVLLVLWKIVSFILNILFTVIIIGAVTGVVVCCAFLLYINSNIETTYDGLNNLKFDSSLNTTLYYTDDTGKEILLEDDTLHGSENRLWAEYREMPQDLIDAFVSIEDKRYFSHNGVDLKRTLGAVLNYFLPGGGDFGGSTLTQQLIKNVSQENETTIQRKVQEIFRALYVEKNFSKEEILEMYLNVISFSQNANGVKAAARAYFNKDLKDLTLVECAALAAIPKYPTYYDPLRNPDNNLLRRNLVLKTMLENGYITQEEYDNAYNVPLYLDTSNKNVDSGGEKVHNYYIDAVIEDVTKALMERYNVDRTTASRKLYSGGLQIVVNMDPDIQSIMESVFTDDNCFPKTTGIKFQAAMVVMDPTTGRVLGIVGGRGEKTVNRGLNRATMSTRQCGSAIKPLSVYAYAIDRGLINYGTPMLDIPSEYDEKEKKYWPANSPEGYEGIISLLTAVQESKNTTAVRLVQQIGLLNSYDFLVKTLGFTTLVERKDYGGVIKSDITISPLALGSFTEGVTVLEVTQGYTMFSNGGAVSKARTFSMVRDSNGEIIIDNRTPEQTQAISEQSAYIMTKILQTVVSDPNGTASYMFNGYLDSPKFTPKIEVAGKTGSTNDDRDRYFVGYTPDFTAAVWVGYDNNKSLSGLKYNAATRLWIEVFNRIYSNLDAKNKAYKKTFDEPYGIIKTQYCIISGKLVSEPCKHDLQHVLTPSKFNAINTGYFTINSVPTDSCNVHVMFKWDKERKAIALNGTNCPEGNLIDVSLRQITQRVFKVNLVIEDSQYTCIDPSLLGKNYVYPSSRTVPYFYNLYEKGTYPGRSSIYSSYEPYNRICIEHYSPVKPDQDVRPDDILTGGG
jgi:penicillin-binding protein 1A